VCVCCLDVHGAASLVIKNPEGRAIPPLTLSQAGTMCVCRSKTWDSKILAGGYWVFGNQVCVCPVCVCVCVCV